MTLPISLYVFYGFAEPCSENKRIKENQLKGSGYGVSCLEFKLHLAEYWMKTGGDDS